MPPAFSIISLGAGGFNLRQLGLGIGLEARQRLLRVGLAVALLDALGLFLQPRLALGLFARGRGAAAAAAGETRVDGRHPVNTCGGCLSRGHPPEVTPLYDVVEAAIQVLGRAGSRQVARRRFAMTISELGKYNAALVHVLEGVA